LREALDATVAAPKPERRVEQLNRILLAANALDTEKKASLTKVGFLTIDELSHWHTTEAGVDFSAFVLRQLKRYEEKSGITVSPAPEKRK